LSKIPILTKFPEHRGVPNRILCKLGWVGRLPNAPYRKVNPRSYELDLRPDEDLLDLRTELLSLLDDPTAFITLILDTDDDAWVERCLAIIRGSTM
jgi:hypothetical protein